MIHNCQRFGPGPISLKIGQSDYNNNNNNNNNNSGGRDGGGNENNNNNDHNNNNNITTKPRYIRSVNKNQIYSTYPMFIFVKLAFGGHCLHFQVYTINSMIYKKNDCKIF